MFAPNIDVITGRSAIAALNLQYVNFDIKEAREETTAFYGNEEYLIDEGAYLMKYGAENIINIGKY